MKYKRNDKILATEQGDELILLNPETGKYFGTNVSGAIIWSLLERALSVEEITARVLKDYSGDEIAVRELVGKFIGELTSRNLVCEANEQGR